MENPGSLSEWYVYSPLLEPTPWTGQQKVGNEIFQKIFAAKIDKKLGLNYLERELKLITLLAKEEEIQKYLHVKNARGHIAETVKIASYI